MPRRHGRNAALYATLGATGSASPVAFLNDWAISSASAKADVTCFGDTNLTYVVGLPDATGTFAGFYDSNGADFFAASQDGQPRKFYMYTDLVDDPGDYFFGLAFFDFAVKI